MERADLLEAGFERDGDEVVVSLNGELDHASAPALRHRLDELLGDDSRTLTFVCDGLRFIDSAGLRLLLEMHHDLDADGGRVPRRAARRAGGPEHGGHRARRRDRGRARRPADPRHVADPACSAPPAVQDLDPVDHGVEPGSGEDRPFASHLTRGEMEEAPRVGVGRAALPVPTAPTHLDPLVAVGPVPVVLAGQRHGRQLIATPAETSTGRSLPWVGSSS